jgi:hypothetical protein
MDDAFGMGSIQSVCNLNAQIKNFFDLHRFSRDQVLERLPFEQFHCYERLAILYARLGEKEKALQALECAYQERQLHMTEIGIEPAFDALRSEPRFHDLLHHVGLLRE